MHFPKPISKLKTQNEEKEKTEGGKERKWGLRLEPLNLVGSVPVVAFLLALRVGGGIIVPAGAAASTAVVHCIWFYSLSVACCTGGCLESQLSCCIISSHFMKSNNNIIPHYTMDMD